MEETVVPTVVVRAQFQEMLNWSARGWRPAPPGRVCPECGGAVWLKVENGRKRWEAHRCVSCAWGQDYKTA